MFEVTTEMLNNVPIAVIAALAAGLLRSVAGWLENALKDGKVDAFEMKQLGGTMVKYFASVSLLMLGLPVEQAVAGAFVLDAGTSALKAKTV